MADRIWAKRAVRRTARRRRPWRSPPTGRDGERQGLGRRGIRVCASLATARSATPVEACNGRPVSPGTWSRWTDRAPGTRRPGPPSTHSAVAQRRSAGPTRQHRPRHV